MQLQHSILFELGSIVVLGIGAQWLAWRLGLPSILLLLAAGFMGGPILGIVETDALMGDLLQPFVSVSVAIILFEGGLSLRFSELREARVVRNLVSIGMLVTWGLSTTAAYFLVDLDFALSALLGAVVVVSGPTVIIPMLRHIRPVGQVSSILKWEGIVIDPIGAAFAVLVFEAVFIADEFQEATTQAVASLIGMTIIGVAIGLIAAFLLATALRRHWVPEYLENAVTLMIVIGAFGAADLVHAEAGLFSATVMGIALANNKNLVLKHIVEFKENLGVLLVSSLFVLLAARLKIEDFEHIGLGSVVFLAILILIVRPVAVVVSTWRSTLTWQERVFLAWMAPRGIVAAAVASIFALELHEIDHPDAERLVPLTFLVIVGTVVIYGLTAGQVARWLNLSRPTPQGVLFAGAHGWARNMAAALQQNGFEVLLVDTNQENIAAATVNDLPAININILSEHCVEEAATCGVGRLVALTSNNEVNSLAALQFTELFGRAEVYQLSSETENRHYGRVLFHEKSTHLYLTHLCENGAEVETLAFETEGDIKAFQERYKRDEYLPLFIIEASQTLTMVTADTPPVPRIGQKIVSFARNGVS